MPECGSLRPWEMEDLTLPELDAVRGIVRQLERQAKEAARRG